MLFQLVLVKLSAEQKTVKLLWVAYLSCYYAALAVKDSSFECLLLNRIFKDSGLVFSVIASDFSSVSDISISPINKSKSHFSDLFISCAI
jgi:hypothetical protein